MPKDSAKHIEVTGIKIEKIVNLMQIFITCDTKPITIIANIVLEMLLNKIALMSNNIGEACVEKIPK